MKRLKISLKAARVNKNYTQEYIAKELKKSKTTINNWENGKTSPDKGNFESLCRIYDVSTDDIILPF